jgi:hypothetical protein
MIVSLIMLSVAAVDAKVIAKFDDSAAAREGIIAEQIMRQATIKAEAFADALVEAENLTSWSSQDPTSSYPSSRFKWRARHAADGREVVVYFAPDKRSVCRIRRQRGGLSEAHWRAIRWCAASLGITLPAGRQPPVQADRRRSLSSAAVAEFGRDQTN